MIPAIRPADDDACTTAGGFLAASWIPGQNSASVESPESEKKKKSINSRLTLDQRIRFKLS